MGRVHAHQEACQPARYVQWELCSEASCHCWTPGLGESQAPARRNLFRSNHFGQVPAFKRGSQSRVLVGDKDPQSVGLDIQSYPSGQTSPFDISSLPRPIARSMPRTIWVYPMGRPGNTGLVTFGLGGLPRGMTAHKLEKNA
jgi:hypothetical protein